MNVERNRTLLFAKEHLYELQVAEAHSALSWMRKTIGTFGLCVKARGRSVECILLGVVDWEEHGAEYLAGRKEIVVREVESWG